MSVRVLVVDDSSFFTHRLTDILNADSNIEVVGTASNGKEALDKVLELGPDVITMDVEMPVMDGIQAVKEIMKKQPVPILMLSSHTSDGAKTTLDALEAGALDFLPKRLDDISKDKDIAKWQICARVRMLGTRRLKPKVKPVSSVDKRQKLKKETGGQEINYDRYKLVVIGTSTGGPIALQTVVKSIPADFPIPILIVQHMPGNFTTAFSQRLNDMAGIHVYEGYDGAELKPGCALVAPGGQQISVEKIAGRCLVKISEGESDQIYKPSVDIAFTSAASVCSEKVLGIVMTGMGADGCKGAAVLKNSGATIWSQDEASCTVYGMPMAIAKAGLPDRVLCLNDIGPALAGEL